MSLFLRDRAGLLAGMHRVLDHGLDDPAMGRVRFPIDGCLSSSVVGAFALAFVVRLIFTDAASNAQTGTPFEVDIPELREKALRTRLCNVEGGSDTESVHVLPFPAGLSDKLFHGSRFSEYRFGLCGSSKSIDRLNALGFHNGEVHKEAETRTRANRLSSLFRRPMAGQTRRRLGSVSAWGAPPRAAESLSLDLVANDLAEEHKMIFAKFDPILTKPTLSIGSEYWVSTRATRLRSHVTRLPPMSPHGWKSSLRREWPGLDMSGTCLPDTTLRGSSVDR